MKGPDILDLQERLQELAYYQAKLDGVFGSKTEQAVKELQKDNRLHVNGIVDMATWQALNIDFEKSLSQVYHTPSIIIDIDRRILVFVSDNFMKIYPVAVGRRSLPTPLGNWLIVSKDKDWGGAFGARWMRLSVPWGSYGIHGTNNPKSIGKAVSHGCIRMYNNDVIEIYAQTPISTAVTIIGKAYAKRVLKIGDSGTDVLEIQKMLKKLDYYRAKLDGEFGPYTEQAVKGFQAAKHLEPDGIIGLNTLSALQRAHADTFK